MTITINPVTKAKLIKGGAGTGKTDSLIEKINELYEDGATDEEIIVFTSTPDAAMAFTSLLFDKFGYKGTDITVTTPRQYALECLSTEKAFEVTGRDARLVLPYEMGFLMEDMKTSGLRPKRLREMLKFFYRCWTEFEDEDPDWLFGEEEHMVYNLLMEVLSSTRCILEAELTAMTVRYLLKEEEELKKVQYKHVLVDDYEQLSRASQYFVQILATDTITVAADVDAAVQVYESYPYLDGVEEFCKLQPEAEVAELDVCHDSPEIVEALNYYKENMVPESKDLLVDEDMWDEDEEEDFDRSLEGIEEISSENPEEEFETLAKSIQAAIKKGCAPEEIYVLTFHPYWTHMMEKSLSKLSIPSASPTDTRIASGDYRDYKKCRTQLILTALALCANEKDPLAWRCWCGYGDYLGNSVVFTSLRSYAIGTEMDIAQALESLSQMDPQGAQVLIPGIQKLLKPYAEGKRIVKGSKGLSGSSLLSYINKSVNSLIGEENLEGDSGLPHIVKTLSIPSGDTTNEGLDAAGLYAGVTEHLIAPTFEQLKGKVLIGPGPHLIGLSPRILIASGFVNGLYPNREYFDPTIIVLDKKPKYYQTDLHRIYTYLGKARDKLVLSYFRTVRLEQSERFKLKIDRIRLQNAVRQALVSQSIFVDLTKGIKEKEI